MAFALRWRWPRGSETRPPLTVSAHMRPAHDGESANASARRDCPSLAPTRYIGSLPVLAKANRLYLTRRANGFRNSPVVIEPTQSHCECVPPSVSDRGMEAEGRRLDTTAET